MNESVKKNDVADTSELQALAGNIDITLQAHEISMSFPQEANGKASDSQSANVDVITILDSDSDVEIIGETPAGGNDDTLAESDCGDEEMKTATEGEDMGGSDNESGSDENLEFGVEDDAEEEEEEEGGDDEEVEIIEDPQDVNAPSPSNRYSAILVFPGLLTAFAMLCTEDVTI